MQSIKLDAVFSSFLPEKLMIKNAQNSNQANSTRDVGSETKKDRKPSNGLSTAANKVGSAPVIRSTKVQTVETGKTGPRIVRSLGPLRSNRVLESKSGKTEKKSPVIIQKAGPETAPRSGFKGQEQPTSPVGAKSNLADSTLRTASKTGVPGPREGGLSKKGGRDLRSLLSVTNPERGFISAQNLPFLRRFVTEQGKILSRRLTRVTARQQREITKAIKQARILGYLQFVNTK